MKRIVLKGCKNARDLGGVRGLGGKTVKSRRLIRSARPDELTADDCRRLKDVFHVKKIIDLRTDDEIEKKPDVLFGCEFHNVPLRPDVTVGIEYRFPESLKSYVRKFPSMPQMYVDMMTKEYSLGQTKKIFEIFFDAAEKGECVLFHCSEGKDRTGIIAALAEMLLGVEKSEIVKDYLLSNRAFGKRNSFFFALTVIGFADLGFAREFKKMIEAHESMLFNVFEIVKENGGIEEFFKNRLGFTQDDIDAFRANMLS